MKIGFCFFGILYGPRGANASDKDFRHCWPNIKRMLIDPFIERGHEAKIYVSSYKIQDQNIEKEFLDTVKPEKVHYSEFRGSTPFTTKYAIFNIIENQNLDLIVLSRSDIHFSKIIADQHIEYNKFNFLFKEKDHWNNLKFTTDNFYIWPNSMTSIVKQSLSETYLSFRSAPYYDTHGLYNKLISYVSLNQTHFISENHEFSDVNSYYTICRTKLPTNRMNIMHHEVVERFYK